MIEATTRGYDCDVAPAEAIGADTTTGIRWGVIDCICGTACGRKMVTISIFQDGVGLSAMVTPLVGSLLARDIAKGCLEIAHAQMSGPGSSETMQ